VLEILIKNLRIREIKNKMANYVLKILDKDGKISLPSFGGIGDDLEVLTGEETVCWDDRTESTAGDYVKYLVSVAESHAPLRENGFKIELEIKK